ncbi:MAG: PD40 domain-containing protein [Kiritimatiellae bacterium]|nr:PD40 domain-containing protein [Kiritimatiellia bacterium]
MKILFRSVLFLVLGILISSSVVVAQTDIVIKKSGAKKTAIDISDIKIPAGAAGTIFRQTLENDLKLSGWFTIAPKGRSIIVVRGSFSQSGSGVSCSGEVINTASSQLLLRRSFRADRRHIRQLAHNLSDAIVMAVKKVPGIASTRIAMVGAHGVKKDIYLCDADGKNLTRITAQGAICMSPNWWPDAKSIAYTSFHKGFPDLYRLNLINNRWSKISSFSGINTGGAISPDGTKLALALSKDGNPELYVMDIRSKRLTRLTKTLHSAEASPSWSPDGSKIVYVSDTSGSPQLYVLGSRGGRAKRITFRGKENVSPDWGNDGRIVYSSRRSGRYHICVYDPSDRQSVQLTKEYVDHESPSWAPDSRHIVCVKTVNYNANLYILDTMGDSPVRLTSMSGDWYAPSWSPR